MEETVEVTGIAGGGAGVGRLSDGRVTFAHRTAPGDLARVTVVERRSRWTRSRAVAIERPSPDRRDAPCPYYDRCGGCTLQHLRYPAQLQAKGRIVADALQRIGGLSVDTPDVTASPLEFRYRNRVTFTLRRGRSGVVAGLHALERPDELLDIGSGCLLPEPAITAAWADLRGAWGPDARRLPSGEELRLTLRAAADGVVALAVDGGYAPGRPDEIVEATRLAAVFHRPEGAAAYRALAGRGAVAERWGGEDVEVGGDVFLQVNRGAAERLEAHVLDLVRRAGPRRVVDAYCGVGLHARRLVREGVEVVGIEAHPGAVREAARAAPAVEILEGRVEDRLPATLPADLVILNPPRAGLADQVPGQLAAQPPQRLIYVSCDPATLARDLKRLSRTYDVVGIRSFDLFPQTAHVETVVELERCAIS